MTLFNWIFVPIAFAFGIGIALWVCMFLLNLSDSIYPVITALVGGEPSNSLNAVLTSAILCIGCIIGATITVLVTAFSAPKYQKETAYLALVLGTVISGFLLLGTGKVIFLPAYIAALGAGIASVAYVGRASE
nr:hypothetical protein [uncultured Albidiferax sp.]